MEHRRKKKKHHTQQQNFFGKEDFVSDYCQRFVKSTSLSQDTFTGGDGGGPSTVSAVSLTGTEAQQFYDSVISVEPSNNKPRESISNTRRQRTTKRPPKRIDLTDINTVKKYIAQLFTMCGETGETKELVQHLAYAQRDDCFRNILNASDQYGWTALMCACAAGRLDVVKILIKEGAEYKGVRDHGGRDVFDICSRNGRADVREYLENLDLSSRALASCNSVTGTSVGAVVRCEQCGGEYKTDKRKKHETSTLHIFKDASKTGPKNMYSIPQSNVGFQMMLRSGWQEESGLGPVGTGRKNPIKTTLKQDRAGLGLKDQVQRVSHFDAYDDRSIAHPRKRKTDHDKRKSSGIVEQNWKKKHADKRSKNREWERDLRRYMS